ncbi:MAG: 2-oxoacid:acceptor oxidoreductase family protein [Candidatus Woesearchaeota archaeon]
MDDFFELEFIGRGGQGAKTAAELVAKILLNKGKFVQSFPDFGPERKGAPVRAFTRISDTEIRGCSSEANPNIIILIDPTLLSLNGTLFNIKPEQIVLVNSPDSSKELVKQFNIPTNVKFYAVDATKIALDTIKNNITNSAMLGALSKVSEIFTIDEIKEEFKTEFESKLDKEKIDNNFKAIETAFNQVN